MLASKQVSHSNAPSSDLLTDKWHWQLLCKFIQKERWEQPCKQAEDLLPDSGANSACLSHPWQGRWQPTENSRRKQNVKKGMMFCTVFACPSSTHSLLSHKKHCCLSRGSPAPQTLVCISRTPYAFSPVRISFYQLKCSNPTNMNISFLAHEETFYL